MLFVGAVAAVVVRVKFPRGWGDPRWDRDGSGGLVGLGGFGEGGEALG